MPSAIAGGTFRVRGGHLQGHGTNFPSSTYAFQAGASYTSQSEYQLPKSSFGISGNKCQWNEAESSYRIIDPSEDVVVAIFVAILSAAERPDCNSRRNNHPTIDTLPTRH